MAEFYLDIARDEVEQLKECAGPIRVGTDGYSEHFRHAVAATVFSAMAVDHSMSTLIWVKCFLLTPHPYREKTTLLARKLRNVPERLEFLEKDTSLPKELLKNVKELFERRNRLVHLRNAEVTYYDGGGIGAEEVQSLNEQGRGQELDLAIENALKGKGDYTTLDVLAEEIGESTISLSLSGLSTDIVEEAVENFSVAGKAVKAIQAECRIEES